MCCDRRDESSQNRDIQNARSRFSRRKFRSREWHHTLSDTYRHATQTIPAVVSPLQMGPALELRHRRCSRSHKGKCFYPSAGIPVLESQQDFLSYGLVNIEHILLKSLVFLLECIHIPTIKMWTRPLPRTVLIPVAKKHYIGTRKNAKGVKEPIPHSSYHKVAGSFHQKHKVP
ncbi:hypothetical protein NPIL_378411 [Nephila pilipes]|uniref:Uncharacterized protein n=1 Tax=Nephila pilipes TaxID=299642 RepID=A0A8X6K374_NEPPI|nr:hypothetical protein NPIL_378411 [Nephila pilipes]